MSPADRARGADHPLLAGSPSAARAALLAALGPGALFGEAGLLSDPDGAQSASVSRVAFAPGASIVEQGRPSEAVFFLLEGTAIASRERDDVPELLSRSGPGQCVGELGVLQRVPRAATVRAETRVVALRVEADRFRSWVSRNPRLADYLGTLERIYPLTDGRRLSVYRSQHEGRDAITTLAGDPGGDCVLSTKVLDEDTLVLARGSAERGGGADVVRHERSDPGGWGGRELFLDQIARGRRGEILHARIRGVRIRGVDLDVPRLYQLVRTGEPVDGREIKRFQRSGFLGGRTPVADPSILCSCLGIGVRELTSALDQHGAELEAASCALGVGAACGACLPRAREIALGKQSQGDAPVTTSAVGARRDSRLVPRRCSSELDLDALMQLSSTPQLQVVAVASIFAGVGERFMVQRVGAALPALADPHLTADAEVFLEQESLHITAHEPLNRLLLERVYPASRALLRTSKGMVGAPERLSSKTALAVSAAFEHVADCAFAAFLEEYYRRGRRYDSDPVVHALVEQSGVGELFIWHAGEELSHRHVAFDTMRASGAGWLHRLLGFAFLALQAAFLLIPAVISLRRVARGRARPTRSAARAVFSAGLVLRVALGGARFLLPGFHPERERYPFLAQLEGDMEAFPLA